MGRRASKKKINKAAYKHTCNEQKAPDNSEVHRSHQNCGFSVWNLRLAGLWRLEYGSRLRLKYDGTRAQTRFCLSAKRTSPFTSAGASFQSTTGSRGVRISGSNAG